MITPIRVGVATTFRVRAIGIIHFPNNFMGQNKQIANDFNLIGSVLVYAVVPVGTCRSFARTLTIIIYSPCNVVDVVSGRQVRNGDDIIIFRKPSRESLPLDAFANVSPKVLGTTGCSFSVNVLKGSQYFFFAGVTGAAAV
eukprot:scaffold115578_cov75-Attheya_sp.AAC.1